VAKLDGKRVAFLATDGVEQVELQQPLEAVRRAGATAELLSLKPGHIQGFNHHDKGDTRPVDGTEAAVRFVRSFFEGQKPVGAICHGLWMLVEAGVVDGARFTSWPSLQTDLRNAGAEWVDEQVVTDNGLVTSRKPDDLEAFCAKTVEEFAEGVHSR
jgi:protease I